MLSRIHGCKRWPNQTWTLVPTVHSVPQFSATFAHEKKFDEMPMIFHDASPGEIIACGI